MARASPTTPSSPMPRPATRTRILSAGAGAAATVAALSLVLSPPADVDPLGTLGRANASTMAAPAPTGPAQPSAFGVPGVDLDRLGYSGPDLDAVTLASLSEPFSALPTERAADIRDRIARGRPHLEGLHQAKNLLQRALPRQDHHVNAGKVSLAEAEAARVEAGDELVQVRERLAARAAAADEGGPDEGGPDEAPGQVDRAPADAGPPGTLPGPAAGQTPAKGKPPAKDPATTAGAADGKATGKGKAASKGKADSKGKGGEEGKPADAPGFQSLAAPASPAAPVVPVPERLPGESPAEQVGALVVLAKAEAGVLDAERAVARASEDLEARKARRRAFRAAAAAAEHEVWRMDAHLRWLEYEQWLAQGQMPSTGNWLVLEERADRDLPIVKVRGFRVHRALADSVRQLVDSAAAAGIDLKGSAHRPVSRQVELRRQNCGPTDFDIFEKSPSLCSPPTAKPGRSLHELGLALDLQNGPNSIVSRRDPAFRWLQQHAPSYGLYNLPAEPWHWSVTGQ